ncbi:MAG: glycosyltransferase family 2 protein [Bacteroidales bacterium]|jgi:glycosyltransferase involved in cell wall biosynthesis|nr:glycosyltransferase family 2 protein [Bacteroidales bacterium]
MDISVVIPLYNEAESLPELTEWINSVITSNNFSYEIIFVDDGSNDNSWQVISELKEKYKDNIKGISFLRNYGKSPALHTGFQVAQGDVVITLDADLQDSPDEIPALYQMIKNENFDLVSGWKKIRHDPVLSKNIPSKLFNFIVRIFTGIKLHDFNCGIKAYKNKVVKSIEIYGEMHRYIPVIAQQAGFLKIGEKIVEHRKRKFGYTKFGLNRYVNGYLDLLTVLFISKFGKKPMHFFGVLGTIVFLVGFFSALYIGIHKIIAVCNHIALERITQSPFFYIALMCMILGSLLFLTGFLGELISRSSSDRNSYYIDKKI